MCCFVPHDPLKPEIFTLNMTYPKLVWASISQLHIHLSLDFGTATCLTVSLTEHAPRIRRHLV